MNHTTLSLFYIIIKAVLVTGMTMTGVMKSSIQEIDSLLTKGIDRRQSTFTMTIGYNTNLSEKRSW
ncbi:MAG TPA: hypothetical protein VE619_03705 [Nitrososphaeraceae archaeon]|nr:hypothetical protein [Nitrososphaeraceae archaeon]